MVMLDIDLENPMTKAAGARSDVYRLLARGFRSPETASGEEPGSDDYSDALRSALAGLPFATGAEPPAGSGEDLSAVYLALFDIGGAYGKPCFLYEGEHGGGRMKALDDVLRFYHFFGLRLDEDRRDRPDHLATELELLHYFCFREAQAQGNDADVDSLRRAERDFLRLHLVPLVVEVARAVESSGAPFYPALAHFAAAYCVRDLAQLESKG